MKVLLFLLSSAALLAETYTIQPQPGSDFRLYIHKTGPIMGGKKHDFLFERYQGKLDYDAGAPEKSRVDLTIDTASVVVKDDWVKQSQLKDIHDEAVGNNGLQASKHPRMRFVSTTIEKKPDGTFTARGTLTIRGIDKPAEVAVTLAAQAERLTLTGSATVKLTDYGIKPPKAALGLVGTRNEMDVRFKVIAVK
ncbi:MAG: YceI family protein [Bryobacteraceae bacterium]